MVPSKVTPFVGVWIETIEPLWNRKKHIVTPFVGVWIETLGNAKKLGVIGSHPSWVCGLKQVLAGSGKAHQLSHPSWVCGLKLGYLLVIPCPNRGTCINLCLGIDVSR